MIYNALVLSHLTYYITSWVASLKLNWQKFSLFKKDAIVCCLVKNIHNTHDHQNLYETCAKARRYEDHVKKKSFALEHTKSLFSKRGNLNLENLYQSFAVLSLHVG